MRKSLAGVVSIAIMVAACGGFGSEGEEQSQQPPPPSTSDENAKPPPDVPGKPIEGIYVSAKQGKAGATGYPGSPVPTIAEGMKIARDKKLRLIVCAEEYAENFEVLNGVSAYGYYDCSAPLWKRTNEHAKVRAPKTPAMTASDIELPTRIEGFDVFAPDLDGAVAIDREGTSVGLLARNTKPGALIIGECTLHGGKAAPGRDGDVALAPPLPGVASGNPGAGQGYTACNFGPAVCSVRLVAGPAGTAPVSCGDEPAPGQGGKGGDGMWWVDGAQAMHPATEHRGLPLVATAKQAQGGPAKLAAGLAGAEGGAGTDGANGAWRFDLDGFVLGDGTRGGSGAPGQGGGGGGGTDGQCTAAGCAAGPNGVGTYYQTATGGGGASGGCGGLAGHPGGGGGASVGVLAFDAAVTFERSVLEPSSGGRAGLGRLGGVGRTGGTGGSPGHPNAGRGGDGGAGGVGGSSGHGASGPAIALAWLRVRPTRDDSTQFRQGIGGEGRGPLSQVVGEPKTIAAMPTGATINEHEIKLE